MAAIQEKTEDAWSSWEDFLAGYRSYQNYVDSPETYCSDWVVRATEGAAGETSATLALAEAYSEAVLGQPIPAFFDPQFVLEYAYQRSAAEDSGSNGIVIGAVVGGENCHTFREREAHRNYRDALGEDDVYEYRLPSGRRPDAIDWSNRVVRELKPDNPRAIQRGLRQLKTYVQELENLTGQRWTSFLNVYKK